MVYSIKSALILLPFDTLSLHKSGPRKAIFKSVIVNNKNVSSQCNLTVEIERVLDKNRLLHGIFQIIKVITKLPNSEQSYKGKVQTHNYINRQNQSTTGEM